MKNQYETKGEIVEITVPHNKSGEQFIFAIDADDFSIVSAKASWSMDKNKTSAIANFRQDTKMCKTTMHRLLTGWKNVNFADGDLLNLRRSNMVESVKRKRVRAVGQSLKGNQYKIKRSHAEMIISGKNSGVVLLDKEDVPIAQEYTWNINSVHGYVQARTREGRNKSKTVIIHRLIMGAKVGEGLQVDHINRNRLDNRKHNLRFVTWTENQLNKGLYSNNTSGFRGISTTANHLFCAQMKVGKTHLRKHFKTFEEAKAQRLTWEKEYGVPPLE